MENEDGKKEKNKRPVISIQESAFQTKEGSNVPIWRHRIARINEQRVKKTEVCGDLLCKYL